MVESLVKRGKLSREGADALLGEFSRDRLRLQNDIREAVSQAQARNPDQPLDLATALSATERAVREAAARITTALSEFTPARGMVEDLVKQGELSREGADALLGEFSRDRLRLQNDIKEAVSQAQARNPDQPLDLATALEATRGVVREAVRRITTAENQSTPRPRRSTI
jgi:polyhydroxyalkanoate synthesis regulator phasin